MTAGRAKPADALRITRSPAENRAALMVPCICGHFNGLHEEGVRAGQKVATRCTIITGAGRCGCPLFATGGDSNGTNEPVGPQ
jgi:hypothetical protein